jgi:hypothetical protein
MSGFRFNPSARRGYRIAAGALAIGALALVLSACSGGGGAATGDIAAIGVTTSQMFVTIENKAGLPLLDVNVAIIPVGASTEYTRFVGRLENAERREVALGDFNGRDGTPFSLRIVRPTAVHVTAKDMNNKAYELQTPWQQ